MKRLDPEFIRTQVADDDLIYKRGEHLTVEFIAETLFDPEEVLVGHNKRFIAHKCFGEHILRAVYEYEESIPTLITVYFPIIYDSYYT